jgi:hypothetical protein
MNERYRLGHDVLGPVFAAFAQLLLARAKRDGITRLAFVARDGQFLRDVVALFDDAPQLDYVYFSRISTSLPRQRNWDDESVAEAAFIRAGAADVASLLAYYGVDVSAFASELQTHRLTPDAPLHGSAAVRSLLRDPAFVQRMETERMKQKELLRDYLRQHRLFDDPQTALVDLGWRGSIPHALHEAFADDPEYRPLRSYYFAYWHELGCHPFDGERMTGLLADARGPRTLREGAAYYAAILLESICRAPHGTVLGYERDADGIVTPILAGDSPQREVERAGEAWREPIRQGILDYVSRHRDRAVMRREAQTQLFRLAFFPTASELAAVAGLAHTEGHASAWSRPLIDAQRPSPVRVRRWLGGLTSPWRAGYVMATGGRPLAWMFVAVESLLVAMPWLRRGLRKLALTIARPSS